jgi:hypothetical protein
MPCNNALLFILCFTGAPYDDVQPLLSAHSLFFDCF